MLCPAVTMPALIVLTGYWGRSEQRQPLPCSESSVSRWPYGRRVSPGDDTRTPHPVPGETAGPPVTRDGAPSRRRCWWWYPLHGPTERHM